MILIDHYRNHSYISLTHPLMLRKTLVGHGIGEFFHGVPQIFHCRNSDNRQEAAGCGDLCCGGPWGNIYYGFNCEFLPQVGAKRSFPK